MSMTEPFSIRRSHRDGIAHLTLVGELDLATVSTFEQAFDEAFGDDATKLIVVDLTELEFMDSTGLHRLLQMSAACEDADRLRVISGSGALMRLFEVTGAGDRLPIIPRDRDPLAPLEPRSPDARRSGAV